MTLRFDSPQAALDYKRVERALRYLDTHRQERPPLEDVAGAAGLAPHHFQRLFTRWAGVSPKRFLQFLTREHAKTLLDAGRSVLAASHGAGLSSASRLHDVFVTTSAMTPGEYRSKGRGLRLSWGVAGSPFGPCFVASSERGVVAMGFEGADEGRARLASDWPHAGVVRDESSAKRVVAAAFAGGEVPARLLGTPFQLEVWAALLAIPLGERVSYGQLAETLGRPTAARAVGSAVARNKLAFLIPCHRVIRAIGDSGDYRWGRVRKQALLGWEAARAAEG